MHLSTAAPGGMAGNVADVLGFGFWAFFAVALVIRVVVVWRKGGRKGLLRRVIGPLMQSGEPQSTAFGWRPAANSSAEVRPQQIRTSQHRDSPTWVLVMSNRGLSRCRLRLSQPTIPARRWPRIGLVVPGWVRTWR